MLYIVTFLIAYLIAAINPAIVISKRVLKTDIRNLGSKNAGTTNAIRTMGKGVGAVVFILDLLKVVVSYGIICLVAWLFKENVSSSIKTLYMLASVLGHSYPAYYGFKGGKGVATALGILLTTNYQIGLICLVFAVVLISLTRMVSVGSIAAAILFPVLTIFLSHENFIVPGNYFIYSIIIALIIIFNHRANVKRLLNGTENKISFKKKEEE